jgi:hypothetical protein
MFELSLGIIYSNAIRALRNVPIIGTEFTNVTYNNPCIANVHQVFAAVIIHQSQGTQSSKSDTSQYVNLPLKNMRNSSCILLKLN